MFVEMLQGQIEVHREWVYRTRRGQRYLVLHGDQFDEHRRLPGRGCTGPGIACTRRTLLCNHRVNDLRRLFGMPYWPQTEGSKLGSAPVPASSRSFETGGSSAGPRAGLRRGDLRPHPPRQPVPDRRHLLCQYRRLGGVLLGAGGDRAGEMQLLRWPSAVRGARSRAGRPLIADAA